MYSVLAFLNMFGFTYKKENLNLSKRRLYRWVILAGVVLGILIEIVQGAFIYQRHYDAADMVANGIGTIFGVITFNWTTRFLANINR
jgi:VanZ family protein